MVVTQPVWSPSYFAASCGDAPISILRQYIEQGAGAAPGADVVMVPRKVLEACSESLGSFCSDHGWSQADMDNMDALDLFLVVQHPQQEQPK